MKLVLSFIATYLTCFAASASAAYVLTLSPPGSVLYGDKVTSIKACVTDSSTGAPYSGATFQGGIYATTSIPIGFGATLDNRGGVINTIVSLPGISTGSNGCATIPVSTYGLPSIGTAFWGGKVYASISATTSTGAPSASIFFTIDPLKYVVSPAVISADGTYSVTVQVSDRSNSSGSNAYHGLYLSANCQVSGSNPVVAFTNNTYNPPSVMVDTSNTATFSVTVMNSLFTNPSQPASNTTCYFSQWPNDYSTVSTFFESTNTCSVGLSPGDPNCGPTN